MGSGKERRGKRKPESLRTSRTSESSASGTQRRRNPDDAPISPLRFPDRSLQERSLGLDSLLTEQEPWESVWPKLVRTYELNAPLDGTKNMYHESLLLRDLWWPLCSTEPALFSTTILVAQALRPDADRYEDRLLWFKTHCIRLIQEGLEDPVRSRTDAMLASVVSILMYECIFGEAEDRATHVRGMKRLVDMRGSIMSSDTGWILRRSVVWTDRVQAYLDNRRTYIQTSATTSDYINDPVDEGRGLGHALDPSHPAREALTFYDPRISSTSVRHRLLIGVFFPGQDLLDAIEDVGVSLSLLERAVKQQTGINKLPQDISQDLRRSETRLLALGSRLSEEEDAQIPETVRTRYRLVHEGLRLTALVAVNTVTDFIEANAITRSRRDHSMQALALLDLESLLESDPIVLLWITFTVYPSSDAALKPRFHSLAEETCRKLELKSVSSICDVISKVLYSSQINDEAMYSLARELKLNIS